MNSHKIFLAFSKTLATILLIGMQLYFGPVGIGSGACDGVILYAIWAPFFNVEEK